jgi:geranylgeranyl diphosphate synthase, type II
VNKAAEQTCHDLIADAAAEVEGHIQQRLEDMSLPDKLLRAIRYALLGGGKRLRPVLTLLSCEAVGGRRDNALSPAAALEMIHAFSLVHDDLPAMDDDDMRRGRPTLHIHAGEAMAILAGDAMMSLAFQFVTEAGLDDARTAAVTSELALGTTHMIAGQVYDTLGGFPEHLTDRERLELIHRNKTGALIRAGCRIGAICGEANDVQMEGLTRYGEAVGLMFQIVDDVLDVTQSADHIGKATGKDLTAGKLTFPGQIGIEASRQEIDRLQQTAIDALSSLPTDRARPLADMCRYLAIRTK